MIQEDYYNNKEYISNSQLGELLISPKQFKHNLEFPREPSDEMKFGTLYHMFILEPELFKEGIIVFDGKKPQNEQQKKFCVLCQTMDRTEAYGMVYSTKNKSGVKVELEAQSLYDELIGYINIANSDKTIISRAEYQSLLIMYESIHAHKKANALLTTPLESYIEYPIYWEFMGVKIKSRIDKFIINRQDNVITQIDLKSTDRLFTFQHSFKRYGYARQLACYYLAIVSENKKLNLDAPESQWKLIVTETGGLYETKVINVSEEIIQTGVDEFKSLIEKYKLHLQYGFDYNIDYYLGSGDEELILTI